MPENVPLKYIDIQNMLKHGIRRVTPNSLAFMLPQQIPAASTTSIDPRRLPFNEISPALRNQRQSLAIPSSNTPFSVFNAMHALRQNSNINK